MIRYLEEKKLFQLDTINTTYVIGLTQEGYVGHVYYGDSLFGEAVSTLLRTEEPPFTPSKNLREKSAFLDFFPMDANFKWIYVLSAVWQEMGWGSIIYFATLSGVDRSLLEAAEIDGANRFQKIWYINVPVLIPTIIILLILQCGSLLSVGYEKVYLLQNTTNLSGSEVISTYVYKVGLEQADFSFGAAADLFNSVINSTILILANFIAKRTTDQGLF